MNLSVFDTVFALGRTPFPVPFSAIPEPLLEDFRHFMIGRAFIKRDGEFLVYQSDFKDWLRKLANSGVEYLPSHS